MGYTGGNIEVVNIKFAREEEMIEVKMSLMIV